MEKIGVNLSWLLVQFLGCVLFLGILAGLVFLILRAAIAPKQQEEA
ncbi:MAG: hypothetical protein HY741_27855 [Chloroflexi bacterium]|nr:hypothetical protein [Chloroflexota bacterium]